MSPAVPDAHRQDEDATGRSCPARLCHRKLRRSPSRFGQWGLRGSRSSVTVLGTPLEAGWQGRASRRGAGLSRGASTPAHSSRLTQRRQADEATRHSGAEPGGRTELPASVPSSPGRTRESPGGSPRPHGCWLHVRNAMFEGPRGAATGEPRRPPTPCRGPGWHRRWQERGGGQTEPFPLR